MAKIGFLKEIQYSLATDRYLMHDGNTYYVHKHADDTECFVNCITGEAYPVINAYHDDNLVFVYEVEVQ